MARIRLPLEFAAVTTSMLSKSMPANRREVMLHVKVRAVGVARVRTELMKRPKFCLFCLWTPILSGGDKYQRGSSRLASDTVRELLTMLHTTQYEKTRSSVPSTACTPRCPCLCPEMQTRERRHIRVSACVRASAPHTRAATCTPRPIRGPCRYVHASANTWFTLHDVCCQWAGAWLVDLVDAPGVEANGLFAVFPPPPLPPLQTTSTLFLPHVFRSQCARATAYTPEPCHASAPA